MSIIDVMSYLQQAKHIQEGTKINEDRKINVKILGVCRDGKEKQEGRRDLIAAITLNAL